MGLGERLQDCKEAVLGRWLEEDPWACSVGAPPERRADEEEQIR